MKSRILFSLTCLLLLTAGLLGQTKTRPTPIPEEARKHFVMGTTLFKDAKTAADFTQVAGEFKQATELAPLWPEPRYNLALAKEAAGDYAGEADTGRGMSHFGRADTEIRSYLQDSVTGQGSTQAERPIRCLSPVTRLNCGRR